MKTEVLRENLYEKKKRLKKFILRSKEKWNQKPDRFYFHFLPIDNMKIVFDSYVGQGYSDNQKAIAQEILNQGLNYDLVFLSNDNCEFPMGIWKVNYGSRQAMRELATANMWIFNTRVVRHPQKRKNQIYLQTWHGGYPLKQIEKQAEKKLDNVYISLAKEDGKITDAVISSSSYLSEIYKKDFWLNENAEILEYGVPKNDVLFSNEYKKIINQSIREKYGISNTAIIILYFPTFRNDGQLIHYNLDYKKVIDAFENLYNREVVLLVRFHPNLVHRIGKSIVNSFDDNVINVTDYPDASDFYCIADCMISDYSGVMLAFALQKKPLFIYANDAEEYAKERGFNELYDKLPCKKCKSNNDLVNEIINFDEELYMRKLDEVFEYINSFDKGIASQQTVEWIKKSME